MKKVFKFILILLIWILPNLLFKMDNSFYNSINLPNITPPKIVFPLVWTIIYILITINIFKITNEYNLKDIKDYTKPLIINYISNQLFTFIFFGLKNTFLAFVDTIIVLISLLFMYYESKSLNKEASKYLIPYLIWALFAAILSLSIYFMNL